MRVRVRVRVSMVDDGMDDSWNVPMMMMSVTMRGGGDDDDGAVCMRACAWGCRGRRPMRQQGSWVGGGKRAVYTLGWEQEGKRHERATDGRGARRAGVWATRVKAEGTRRVVVGHAPALSSAGAHMQGSFDPRRGSCAQRV